jgi:hypothetical protein
MVGREQPALDAGGRLIVMIVVVSGVGVVIVGHDAMTLCVFEEVGI